MLQLPYHPQIKIYLIQSFYTTFVFFSLLSKRCFPFQMQKNMCLSHNGRIIVIEVCVAGQNEIQVNVKFLCSLP